MVGQQPGELLDPLSKNSFHGLCNSLVDLLAGRAKQRLVGNLLRQSVLENIFNLGEP